MTNEDTIDDRLAAEFPELSDLWAAGGPPREAFASFPELVAAARAERDIARVTSWVEAGLGAVNAELQRKLAALQNQ